MTTTMTASEVAADLAAIALATAERQLFEAEFALHIAHQSGVDAWIAAATDRLHDAITEEHRASSALQRIRR